MYEAKGELSSARTTIERIGLGGHLAAIERLKRALAAEGLFDAERKRPAAALSARGRHRHRRGRSRPRRRRRRHPARFPAAHIVVAETRVQGSGAGLRIASALRRVAAHPEVDVVVVARGGGSFEDLLPFSEEIVVRAVATLPGAGRLGRRSRAGHAALRPRRRRARLDPDRRGAARRARPRRAAGRPDRLRERLDGRRPAARSRATASGWRATGRLRAAPLLLLERRRAALDHAAARLQALSPHATLARGYAIVRPSGAALRDAGAVAAGQPARDRAGRRRARRHGRRGAAVSERRDERDVRGAPPRARGDRRDARARRGRSRRGDPALAARRGAPPALRAPARGRRRTDRGALRESR